MQILMILPQVCSCTSLTITCKFRKQWQQMLTCKSSEVTTKFTATCAWEGLNWVFIIIKIYAIILKTNYIYCQNTSQQLNITPKDASFGF
jgi:hypothetical protein